jgi:hypothetical protein
MGAFCRHASRALESAGLLPTVPLSLHRGLYSAACFAGCWSRRGSPTLNNTRSQERQIELAAAKSSVGPFQVTVVIPLSSGPSAEATSDRARARGE